MSNQGVIQQTMDVELEGRGALALKPSHYITTGGEGSLYRPSRDTVVKIYSDPRKMIRDGMTQKIELLKKLHHDFIVNPLGVVHRNHTPIGYYMQFVEGDALAQVFTSAYQSRERFTKDDMLSLVDGMRAVVMTAHANKAVLVDANELNWLVNRAKKKAEPRVIDVDSWAIGAWKASVIMPSIRDWHTKGFNEQSDWFSFGVVSFQVFSGIHPYKGTLKGYATNDIEHRMKDRKSVFAPGVQVNRAVRDFAIIPDPLRLWYEAVFQGNERGTPPSPYDKALKIPQRAVTNRTVVTSSGMLVLHQLYDAVNDAPIRIYSCGVALLRSGRMVDIATDTYFDRTYSLSSEVVATEWGYLVAERDPFGVVSFTLVDKKGKSEIVNASIQGDTVVRFQNRLFSAGAYLTEITVKKFAQPMIVSLNSWQCLPNATRWFNGIGVQDTLGMPYLIIPFQEQGVQYVAVKELEGKKVVDAVAGNRYAALLVLDPKTGLYHKYEIVFDREYGSYQVAVTDLITPDINIALLPKGVCATIVEDGKLHIMVPSTGALNVVQDGRIDMSYTLFNWENKVVATQGSKIWSISLK